MKCTTIQFFDQLAIEIFCVGYLNRMLHGFRFHEVLESTSAMFFFFLIYVKQLLMSYFPEPFSSVGLCHQRTLTGKIFLKGQDDMTLQNYFLAYCLIKNLMILHNFGSGSIIFSFRSPQE